MKLHIAPDDWTRAKTFFSSSPEEKKYIPSPDSLYFFIKTDKSEILALARKPYRDQYTLGKGYFSTVVTAQDEAENIHACKLIDPDYVLPDDHSVAVMQHLNILKGQTTRLKRTPHVLRKENQERVMDKKGYQIIELAPGESLDDIYLAIDAGSRNPLNTLQKDMIALNCCLQLLKYHQLGVIHGDLNYKNIHVQINGNDVVVTLVDQGFSLLTHGQSEVKIREARGTPGFAAPEILSFTPVYSYKSDIYALGRIFDLLNRPQWANNCFSVQPNDRFSLYETLSLILQKILTENKTLSAHNDKISLQAERSINEHFEEKLQTGIPLSLLLRSNSQALLLNGYEMDLLALQCCQAFHRHLQLNPYARIYGYDNFMVKKQGNNLIVTFDETINKIDAEILAPEIRKGNYDPEKSSVYSLGMIVDKIGISPGEEINPNYSKRPTFLKYMSSLLEFAKETPDNPYQTKLEEIESYICEFQILSASDENSLSPNTVNLSDNTLSDDAELSDDDHISSFSVLSPAPALDINDELEREIDALELDREVRPSLLRMYIQLPAAYLPPSTASENLAAAAAAPNTYKPF